MKHGQNSDSVDKKQFTAGTTWTFDTEEQEPSDSIPSRREQLEEFFENFETEVGAVVTKDNLPMKNLQAVEVVGDPGDNKSFLDEMEDISNGGTS